MIFGKSQRNRCLITSAGLKLTSFDPFATTFYNFQNIKTIKIFIFSQNFQIFVILNFRGKTKLHYFSVSPYDHSTTYKQEDRMNRETIDGQNRFIVAAPNT